MTIAGEARNLIADPQRHTSVASAIDAQGEPVAGATDLAVAWSGVGAVNRVAVLNHGTDLDGWRTLILALSEAGVRHDTPHQNVLAVLARLA